MIGMFWRFTIEAACKAAIIVLVFVLGKVGGK